MGVEEAIRLGIALEIPDDDYCPHCKTARYECGTRRSVRSIYGKVMFQSGTCIMRSEWIVFIQSIREEESGMNQIQ